MEFSHIAILIMQMSTMRAILASSREKFFWSGVWIYSLATGLASMIFMAWAFYVETTGPLVLALFFLSILLES